MLITNTRPFSPKLYMSYLYMLKVAIAAEVPGITSETVWQHFLDITVPVIQEFQGEEEAPLSDLVDLVDLFARAMRDEDTHSEVNHVTLILAHHC